MEEANQHQQQEHFGRTSQKYQSYALYACNSQFDAKATFGAHGEFNECIGMSEKALQLGSRKHLVFLFGSFQMKFIFACTSFLDAFY